MRILSFFVYSLFVIAVTGNTIGSFAQGRQMGGVGITVFSERNFRGTSATYREDIPDGFAATGNQATPLMRCL